MASGQPRVTVGMAAYNEREHLRAAVESVLGQTFSDFELVVVDDGSVDGCIDTLAGIDDPRLRIRRQPNRGKAAAMNRIVAEARGEYMCIQDADDLANPDRLATQVAALDADPELGAVFCRHELIVDGERRSPRYFPADRATCAAAVARMRNPAHDPTIMFRLEETGRLEFAEELRIGEVEDYLLRIGEQHPMIVVAGCHYAYRLHEGNLSKADGERTLAFRREVLRRACERRGQPVVDVRRPGYVSRQGRAANVTGHVVSSTVELRALGRRRRAVRDAVAHLRGTWRHANSWLPLAYSVVPGVLLARLRPDYPALVAGRADVEATVTC